MELGRTTERKAAKVLLSVTAGHMHALGTFAALMHSGLSFSEAISFFEERGLPEDPQQRGEWWESNCVMIREQAKMRGARFD